MKKSIIELVRARQKRKFVAPASQEPGDEKPNLFLFSLKSLKNRISKNDFQFLRTVKLEQNIPTHQGAIRDFTYAPTEKPW